MAGEEAGYAYDAWGRRVEQHSTQGVILSQYARDGRLVFQLDRDGTYHDYFYLGRKLVAIRDYAGGVAVKMHYVHTDALGTNQVQSDANGQVEQSSAYDSYGGHLTGNAADQPGYTGHVEDSLTGLTYMQQRYYDPALSRFISVDPVGVDTASGGNFNRYWYAKDNPYRYTDPDGRKTTCGAKQCTITADTFKPATSNHQTVVASPAVRSAAEQGKATVAVHSGNQEKLGFVVKGSDGKLAVQNAADTTTGQTATGSTASAKIPANAVAVTHGHIDSGPNRSNGMVDDPASNGGYGDTQGLKAGLPEATVSHGQVGWHEIKNGQLQFTYPAGALNGGHNKQMQSNLDVEQLRFQQDPQQ